MATKCRLTTAHQRHYEILVAKHKNSGSQDMVPLSVHNEGIALYKFFDHFLRTVTQTHSDRRKAFSFFPFKAVSIGNLGALERDSFLDAKLL